MTAKILTIANQKGGSGKTNLAMSLGGAFGRRGFRVVVVDGDSQGTATQWYSCAPDDQPFPATVQNLAAAGRGFARAVRPLVPDHDIIVIDTPPNLDSQVLIQALSIADVALVPMVPSPGDLWATAPLLQVVDQTTATNPDITVRIMPSMVQATTMAQLSIETLPNLGFEVLPVGLTQRVAFRQAIGLGVTVLDLKDDKAKNELNAVADEALTLLRLPTTLLATKKKRA